MKHDFCFRPVENLIFIWKADLYNEEDNTVARIDPGVRMDAKLLYLIKDIY